MCRKTSRHADSKSSCHAYGSRPRRFTLSIRTAASSPRRFGSAWSSCAPSCNANGLSGVLILSRAMKGFAIDRYGGPEVLALRDLPEPEPGPGDLLVEVHAASVNPVDFKIRHGGLKVLVKDRFPLVLGCDLSGVVARVGPNVTRFSAGDEIFARLRKDRIGGFAQRVLVDESVAARKPANLTHREAASIPLVG